MSEGIVVTRNPNRGIELGYAQITSTITTTSASFVDATGLSVDVTVGARPVKVVFDARSLSSSTTAGVTVAILEDGVQLATQEFTSPAANNKAPFHREVRSAPSAGSHTYKIQWLTSSGTASMFAGASSPTFIEVIEI